MIQIILKFTFLSQIFPDQQHGNLVIHQLFSTQYLFQLNNSVTQQLNNSFNLFISLRTQSPFFQFFHLISLYISHFHSQIDHSIVIT